MIKFIIKRLVALIPVLIGVSLLVFFILDLAPGDPAKTILGEQARPEAIAALREEMGLDAPFFVRYGRYMWDLVHGALGREIRLVKKFGHVCQIPLSWRQPLRLSPLFSPFRWA